MGNFFAWLLIIFCVAFFGFQIFGFIKDIRAKKAAKKHEVEENESEEAEEK